jgi:hypothetical protein
MFEENPCRRNPFAVFMVDRSETNLRAIRLRVDAAWKDWEFHGKKIRNPDGSETEVDEARMNEMKARLEQPLKRLKEEQLVHRSRPFVWDREFEDAMKEFSAPPEAPELPTLPRSAVLNLLGPLLPEVPAPVLADDMPWPEPPPTFPREREPLEQAILRDF